MEMQLSSSESMKLYILHSDSMAFISVHAVLKELAEQRMPDCGCGEALDRSPLPFYNTPRPGRRPLPELFMRFALYQKK